MNTVIITPARYDSTRFPGKPLAMLGGREIVLRVMDRISTLGCVTAVATDDRRIYDKVEGAGYKAVMTARSHQSGTDRVREALDIIEKGSGIRFDIVINVQGDEPFIDPAQIRLLQECFNDRSTDIATLARPFPDSSTFAELSDPNVVKIVKSPDGKALYFSRSVIPYLRGVDKESWVKSHKFFSHIGIYGYRADVLRRIADMPRSPLEKAESLEQLRWLEAGLAIKVAESTSLNIGIDTPADLRAAEEYMRRNP